MIQCLHVFFASLGSVVTSVKIVSRYNSYHLPEAVYLFLLQPGMMNLFMLTSNTVHMKLTLMMNTADGY